MKNYKKLVSKGEEVEGFIKTFGETCRPDNDNIAKLDTRGKELNKISNIMSEDDIKKIESNNSRVNIQKQSIFYKDVNCDIKVFDFDVISLDDKSSMDAFLIDDKEESYLMIEAKERSMILINKCGDYLIKQNDTINMNNTTPIKNAVKSMFDKYTGMIEKLKVLECDVSRYFRNIILFIDIRVAESISLVSRAEVQSIIKVEVNKYVRKYKKDGFNFQVIYDELEVINRVESFENKRNEILEGIKL